MSSIEDIILNEDHRGISALRPYLSTSYCEEAARFILGSGRPSNRTALIATGFFILSAQAPETDGPPGSVALAKALHALGFQVVYVTDKYTVPLLVTDIVGQDKVIKFPIADHKASRHFAQHLLADIEPSVLISIERCGFTESQRYLNMAGKDITEYTAKIDYLFLDQGSTVGVGDGGNEIGMGNLAPHIRAADSLPDDPTFTPVGKLIIASVSNWGAYGLVTALSQISERNLLPSVEWERDILRVIISRGAVDGISGERKCAVDGFDADQNAQALIQLHQLLKAGLTSQPARTHQSETANS
ncbi:DUF4392 domain-containing protein [Chloroflexota bacterium]